MPPNACFSIEFDKQIGDNQYMAPNTSFSIGFDKEIRHVQSMALKSSFSIGFDKDPGPDPRKQQNNWKTFDFPILFNETSKTH